MIQAFGLNTPGAGQHALSSTEMAEDVGNDTGQKPG
jgi:hypothetical protein